MKNLGLFLVMALLSVCCLTSCLEGSNKTEGYALGVLDRSSKNFKLVLNTTVGQFHAANLESLVLQGQLSEGGCYYIYYKHESDIAENSASMVEANGYMTITLLDYAELSQYYMYSSLMSDTSTVMSDEVALVKAYDGSAYVDGYWFISHTANHESDVTLDWELSYDYSTMVPTEENGERYYDLFIRATKKNSTSKTGTSDVGYINAYRDNGYLKMVAEREKSLLGVNYNSSSTFTLRFNYVSAIDKETNAITWKSTTEAVKITSFVSSSE